MEVASIPSTNTTTMVIKNTVQLIHDLRSCFFSMMCEDVGESLIVICPEK